MVKNSGRSSAHSQALETLLLEYDRICRTGTGNKNELLKTLNREFLVRHNISASAARAHELGNIMLRLLARMVEVTDLGRATIIKLTDSRDRKAWDALDHKLWELAARFKNPQMTLSSLARRIYLELLQTEWEITNVSDKTLVRDLAKAVGPGTHWPINIFTAPFTEDWKIARRKKTRVRKTARSRK